MDIGIYDNVVRFRGWTTQDRPEPSPAARLDDEEVAAELAIPPTTGFDRHAGAVIRIDATPDGRWGWSLMGATQNEVWEAGLAVRVAGRCGERAEAGREARNAAGRLSAMIDSAFADEAADPALLDYLNELWTHWGRCEERLSLDAFAALADRTGACPSLSEGWRGEVVSAYLACRMSDMLAGEQRDREGVARAAAARMREEGIDVRLAEHFLAKAFPDVDAALVAGAAWGDAEEADVCDGPDDLGTVAPKHRI